VNTHDDGSITAQGKTGTVGAGMIGCWFHDGEGVVNGTALRAVGRGGVGELIE
jgi:hypothetical protein